MLVLPRTADAYADDADAAIRYRLPTGLHPLPGRDGVPQALLSRSENGGLLHLRLGHDWPAFGPADRATPFTSGRFRLLLQTPAAL